MVCKCFIVDWSGALILEDTVKVSVKDYNDMAFFGCVNYRWAHAIDAIKSRLPGTLDPPFPSWRSFRSAYVIEMDWSEVSGNCLEPVSLPALQVISDSNFNNLSNVMEWEFRADVSANMRTDLAVLWYLRRQLFWLPAGGCFVFPCGTSHHSSLHSKSIPFSKGLPRSSSKNISKNHCLR